MHHDSYQQYVAVQGGLVLLMLVLHVVSCQQAGEQTSISVYWQARCALIVLCIVKGSKHLWLTACHG